MKRWGVVVALVVSAAGVAVAQGVSHYDRGVQLRRAGRDEDGLAEFRRALDEERSPRARAQVGMSLAALGQWVEADAHLREVLASTDPWIERARPQLQAALEAVSARLGALEVRGGVRGASVLIDGQRVGELPLARPVSVVAGTVNLQVSAPGHLAVARRVVVPARALIRETVSLAAIPPEAPPPLAPASSRPAPAPASLPARGGSQRITGLVVGTFGVAALGLGATGSILQNEETRYLLARPRCQTAECDARREREDIWHSISIAGYVGGGVLTVLGVALFATATSGRPSSPSAALRCDASITPVGVSCGGVF